MAALGVFAFFIVLRDLRYLARAAAGVAVCLVLIVVWGSYWLPATFEQRVLGAVRSGSIEEAGSFQDRVALMDEALEMVDDTMLLGLGVDQYKVKSQYGAPCTTPTCCSGPKAALPALIGLASLLLIALSRRAVCRPAGTDWKPPPALPLPRWSSSSASPPGISMPASPSCRCTWRWRSCSPRPRRPAPGAGRWCRAGRLLPRRARARPARSGMMVPPIAKSLVS